MISDIFEFQRNSTSLRSHPAFTQMCDLEEHKKTFQTTLRVLCSGHNRANGFMGICEPDSNRDHWSFSCGGDERLQLQGVNCKTCGEYMYFHNIKYIEDFDIRYLPCPYNCICKCKRKKHDRV